jgi:hypothetical protein
MSLSVQRVVGFLYVGSHRLLHNLTDMCQKPSACIGLCMDMVPMAYQCAGTDGAVLGWNTWVACPCVGCGAPASK